MIGVRYFFLAQLKAGTKMILNRKCIITICFLLSISAAERSDASAGICHKVFSEEKTTHSSFNEVLKIMRQSPYTPDQLPVIHLQMWKWIGNKLSFFVGKRSGEILSRFQDYRVTPEEKPIHPMGIGLVGKLKIRPSQWSGAFSGGEFPVLARASISQDNPYQVNENGEPQKRSTAMAIKVFPTQNLNEKVQTANAVFQNNLNGLLASKEEALYFLQSSQTNQPDIDFTKIKKSYEFLTLIGVAIGALSHPRDKISRFPFINPQIRPVHSLAEMGVKNGEDVKTPIWIQIKPKTMSPVEESDFRLEIYRTLERDGQIEYEVLVGDVRDDTGRIDWIPTGDLIFNEALLTEAVDKNLIFPHDKFHSEKTNRIFELPEPHRQYRNIPEDVQ